MQCGVNQLAWLHTEVVYSPLPKMVTHHITNHAQCRVTSFMNDATAMLLFSVSHRSLYVTFVCEIHSVLMYSSLCFGSIVTERMCSSSVYNQWSGCVGGVCRAFPRVYWRPQPRCRVASATWSICSIRWNLVSCRFLQYAYIALLCNTSEIIFS